MAKPKSFTQTLYQALESWLKKRQESHRLLAQIFQWQIRRKAEKDAKAAKAAYERHKSQSS